MGLSIILLIIGLGLLIKGADLFVDGSAMIARRLKIPSLVIGLTLVSIGTSAPELSVSITSSIKSLNDMSFGNIIGSNIFNALIVIGASSLFAPLIVSKNIYYYDIPIICFINLIVILFTIVITPYAITMWEAIILLFMFLVYMFFLILRSRRKTTYENEESIKSIKPLWKNIFYVLIGLTGIIYGGELVVNHASIIARYFGLSDLLVGLTIVAVGTSLPELVTSIVAAKKGENDIAIGNVIGSNIFNILFILGVSAIICPVKIDNASIIDLILMFASIIFIFIFSMKKKKINRFKGLILILIYILYLIYIIYRNFI